MKIYTLGLNVAGTVQFIMNIPAKNFDSAVLSWAHVTGHIDPLFNYLNHTYFGWEIVETKQEALERKPNIHRWNY